LTTFPNCTPLLARITFELPDRDVDEDTVKERFVCGLINEAVQKAFDGAVADSYHTLNVCLLYDYFAASTTVARTTIKYCPGALNVAANERACNFT